MTAQTTGAGDQHAGAPAGTTADPATQAPAHAPVRAPAEEAALAIEEARAVLAAAAADVASEDADRVAHGYELAAGCADHIARALWFLRRAERDRAAK